jgi:hypothetical protein
MEVSMAKADIKPGVYVQLDDGSTGEVLAAANTDHLVRIRFVESPFDASKLGTEALVIEDLITGWYPNRDVSHTQGSVV